MTDNSDGREQRGLIIAATKKLTHAGRKWYVPSDSGTGKYMVVMPFDDDGEPVCSCPDHETRGRKCKHIHAVEITLKREENPDGSVTETRTLTLNEKRTTYPQNWTAYNAAQVNEKATFQALLRELIDGLDVPTPSPRRGNQPFPVRDGLYAAIFKVYSTLSGRRFVSDLQQAQDRGYIRRVPSYNMIFKVFEQPETFELLRTLIVRAATPLKAVETHFSCDSSGFSGCRFDKWFDHKWGEKKILRAWVKAHVMTGVKTNCITAVEIHDQYANDGTQLKPLLATTAERFTVKEVSGDLAYSTHANLEAINAVGATPLIPFKRNATASSGGLWAKMFHYFQLSRDEFLARYHQRSNVESTFSMVKAKFGDSCRSKCDTAMKNEVLAKLICHNICCVILAMHELGVDPSFYGTMDSVGRIASCPSNQAAV